MPVLPKSSVCPTPQERVCLQLHQFRIVVVVSDHHMPWWWYCGAVVIPVLEKCELNAKILVAKVEHATLMPIRLGVMLPRLSFFISPARLRRMMRIIRLALPGIQILCADVVIGAQNSVDLQCSFRHFPVLTLLCNSLNL